MAWPERLCVAVPRGHALAAGRGVSIDVFRSEPLISSASTARASPPISTKPASREASRRASRSRSARPRR
ncbi:hypothetical protein R1A27_30585 (plasmid) [Methylobacterium sp. NMS12]